ncbi:hypothetical protein SBOR_8693 [Sclerotinia borealis F-4128]|uniref:Uncharacterized protein n=1 Tax=Sclerotinia borealis (strain F-4128) TaxID=1432307 RepID=W9C4X6_SCLBF|nr:hypothetical protein SBOR_8693 [Sclerotinia borealis F-4128]
MSNTAPSSIPNGDVTERETQKKARRQLVNWYEEEIRPALQDRDKKTTYKNALEAWEKHVNKRTWIHHGLIGHRLERNYLEAAATYDIKGNRSKESATVGFVEQFIAAQFPEKRFVTKSQKGVVPKHGPEHQVDDFLAYTNVHFLETGLMMIEAKRHPEDKEDMTKGRMKALEKQVGEYCREWLEENKEIPFLYALTCVSTLMRVWIMKKPTRSRDMKNAKLVGLWSPDLKTWDEYKDAGLDCDADVLKTAFRQIKNNPTGSDYARTSTSETGTGDERVGGAGVGRAETRDRGTDSGDRRTRRTESRDRRASAAAKPPLPSRKENKSISEQAPQQLNALRATATSSKDPTNESAGSHQRRRSRPRREPREPIPSSSPEIPTRELPKPTRPSNRRKESDKAEDPRTSDSPRNREGKKPEDANKGKESAITTTKISRKRADSLSSRPPDSPESQRSTSSSENQRPPPRKSSKTALRTSANPGKLKLKPKDLDKNARSGKPGSGANV